MSIKKLFSICILVTVAAFLFIQTVYAQDPSYDPSKFTTGTITVDGNPCKPTGKGGDAYLNSLKNRDIAPASYDSVSFSDIMNKWEKGFPAGKGSSHYRLGKKSLWKIGQRENVTGYEYKGISVEGYIIAIKGQGAEACNCGAKDFHDYHIWLNETPLPQPAPKKPDKSKSMVAEISPRTIKAHPNWNANAIQHLAKQGSRIRISGWVTWDEEHPEQIGIERATLWEIHPIHKIEVWSNGKWNEL